MSLTFVTLCVSLFTLTYTINTWDELISMGNIKCNSTINSYDIKGDFNETDQIYTYRLIFNQSYTLNINTCQSKADIRVLIWNDKIKEYVEPQCSSVRQAQPNEENCGLCTNSTQPHAQNYSLPLKQSDIIYMDVVPWDLEEYQIEVTCLPYINSTSINSTIQIVPPSIVIIFMESDKVMAGFAGNEYPDIVFPTVVNPENSTVGNEALVIANHSKLRYPIAHGMVIDWNGTADIWNYVFKVLDVNPANCYVFITEPPLNPKANREIAIQIMFEEFNVARYYTAITHMLALYASGRTTGICLYIEDDVTWVVPVYEGYALPHAILRGDFGVKDLRDYLITLLKDRGYNFTSFADKQTASVILGSLGYVAENFTDEMQKNDNLYDFPLSQGETITIGNEIFRAVEVLFKPNLIGIEQEGIHRLVYESIMKCDVDIRIDLFRNIVLTGPGVRFEGLVERLDVELKALAPESWTVKLISPPGAGYSIWVGAAVLSSLSTFDDMWITRSEYTESGPGIVHRIT